jgi:ribonucleotide reductase alpha subunit
VQHTSAVCNLVSVNLRSFVNKEELKSEFEAKAQNRDIYETIYFGAVQTSMELAKEHGPCETFAGSPMSQVILQFDMAER